MKRSISIKLVAVVLVGMLVVLLTNYRLQIRSAKESMAQNAKLRIKQIEQILAQNDAEIERMKANLKEDYIIRAKAAAYIVENRPEIEYDLDELKKVANLLQVDEFHLFDSQGTIYSGTEPKYYGYNFRSGSQMSFFLPLLNDKTLEMSQDVTPNTAEGKLMQYTALWRESGTGIVQIGMEPVRLMEALKKNEISYLFGNMTTEPGITLFAVDGESGEVQGCTDLKLVGRTAGELGLDLSLDPDLPLESENIFSTAINGVNSYCVFRKQESGNWLGVSRTTSSLLQALPRNMFFSAFSLAAVSVLMILFILSDIDRNIIQGVNTIIGKLNRIAGGDLDTRVEVDSSPEFSELSRHINGMVKSLLENTDKLSLVFQNVELPIAAFQYNPDMVRVQATSRLADILCLAPEEAGRLLADQELFRKKITEILSHPLTDREEGDIYIIENEKTHYIKFKTYQDGKSTFGVVIDVTDDERERQRIAQERDVDLLTGLATRRAFFRYMDALYQDAGSLGYTALLMADADRLKQINDTYGHESGDRFLQAIGRMLAEFPAPQKLAARLSGDEFVLFLYGCASEEEASGLLKELETRMQSEELPLPDGKWFPVRLSAGYVISPPGSGNYRETLRMADQAMYEVKRGARGKFTPYNQKN